MRIIEICWLLLGAVAAAGAQAQTPQSMATPSVNSVEGDPGAKQKVATELVALIYRKEAFPAFQPGFDAGMLAAMKQRPNAAGMEKRYPGVLDRMAQRMGPAARKLLVDNLPSLHAELAKYYAAKLSLDDLNAYLAFIRTSAGAALVNGLARNIDVQQAISSVDAKGKLSLDSRLQIGEDAAVRAVGDMSDENLKSLTEFLTSDPGRRAAEVDMSALPITAAWQERLKKNNELRFQRIALESMLPARKK
jgi:hypothetical protein